MDMPASATAPQILLATDFSESAAKAAEVARAEARQRCARLHVLHVVRSSEHAESGSARVRELVERLAREAPVMQHLRVGSPATEIVHCAEEWEVDLVVVGRHGHTGVTRALLGSVAERVARTSTRPVLVVPSERLPEPAPVHGRCIVCGIASEDLVCEPCRMNIRLVGSAPQWAAPEAGVVGELDHERCEHVLRTALVGRLACSAGGALYVVPIAYAYDQGAVYIRSGEGKKARMMREAPSVCMQVDHIVDLANWRSVIVWGTFRELHGAEATDGWQRIMRRLRAWAGEANGWPAPFFEERNTSDGHRGVGPGRGAVVGRIDVTEMTGRYQRV